MQWLPQSRRVGSGYRRAYIAWRREAFDPAYAGAPAGLLQFPNTDAAWNIGQPGDTMAEVRARVTCAVGGCSSIEPSMNVIYRDVWSADPLIAQYRM